MFQIAWLNARPFCWCASVDGGKNWLKLTADDDENEEEAIREASEHFGVLSERWELLPDPITKVQA